METKQNLGTKAQGGKMEQIRAWQISKGKKVFQVDESQKAISVGLETLKCRACQKL